MDDKYRSRKFMFALGFSVSGTILLVTGYINGDQWINLAFAVMSCYGLTNVAESYVAKR